MEITSVISETVKDVVAISKSVAKVVKDEVKPPTPPIIPEVIKPTINPQTPIDQQIAELKNKVVPNMPSDPNNLILLRQIKELENQRDGINN